MTNESNQSWTFELIKSFCGQSNIMSIPRVFIKWTGSIETALFLSQIVHWSDKGHREDGFFYKSNDEWCEELGLSLYAVKKAKRELSELGIIETKLLKAKGTPTTHYRLNKDELNQWVRLKSTSPPDEPVENNQSLTETTLTPDTSDNTIGLVDTESLNTESEDPIYEYFEEKENAKPTPIERERLTPDGYKVRISAALERGARNRSNNKIDLSSYPEDVRGVVLLMHDLWRLEPPEQTKGKSGAFGDWIESSRKLIDTCDEFGVAIIEAFYHDHYTQLDEPFLVSSPRSLLNSIRGYAAKLRTEGVQEDDGTVPVTLEDGTVIKIMPD